MATAGNHYGLVIFRAFDKARVLLVEVCVELRRHVAATTPCFVADGEIMHAERLIAAILATQLSQGRFTFSGHVFHPLRHFTGSTGTEVTVHVGFRTEDFYQIKEFMRTYGIVFFHTTPVGVYFHGT